MILKKLDGKDVKIKKEQVLNLNSELGNKIPFSGGVGNLDCNTVKNTSITGLYNGSNSPNTDIGILETYTYSTDWILQRFTSIQSGSMWERTCIVGGWSSWTKRW